MTSTDKKIAFVSDEPVAFGMRGNPEALARLLSAYPSDKLVIFQTSGSLPPEEQRIKGVKYILNRSCWDRLLKTRFYKIGLILRAINYLFFYQPLLRDLRHFSIDSIVTLIHSNSWMLATGVSRKLNLPINLIVHDGPDNFCFNLPLMAPLIRRELLRACRQAHSRWSISQSLEQYFQIFSGIPGEVLPPLRRSSDKSPVPLSQDLLESNDVVYFGALCFPSTLEMLNKFSDVLKLFNGNLYVYGGISPAISKHIEWSARRFNFMGSFSDRGHFFSICRQKYKFMYLPFSFTENAIKWSFPSKIVDYTLIGLPILLQAPSESPIAAWCANWEGSLVHVAENDQLMLANAVSTLLTSKELRLKIARAGIEASEASFSFQQNTSYFYNRIRKSAKKNPQQLMN